jgi:predicted deacylase
MAGIQIGTVTAKAGEIVKGWIEGVGLPTGGIDRFPLLIGQGRAEGPVFWVTASIHGGEHSGLVAAQRLLTPDLVADLRGTLVVVPTLSPAGLRIKERSPYYFSGDPNRLFPEPHDGSRDADVEEVKPGLELAYQRVYEAIQASGAGYLLDLHTAQIGSLPMVFRDPVFYHRNRSSGLSRREAGLLQDQVGEMLEAFGFTIINEFAVTNYVTKNLHRSVSGAVLNGLGIPAATVELGSWLHIDTGVIEACLSGLRNTLRWAEMLPGDLEPIKGIPVIDPSYPVRRHYGPHAPLAGISHQLVRPGERIEPGMPLARMTDIHGDPLGLDDGLLRSEWDGYVIAWQHGVVRYQGEPIMVLAIRDDSDLVVAYPY